VPKDPEDNCGTRHLALVAWIAGILLVVVGGAFGIGIATASSYAERIGKLEQEKAAVAVQLTQMQRTLDRIEAKLDQ